MADWVRITQNEEIPLNTEGIDFDEIFDYEEEDREDVEETNQLMKSHSGLKKLFDTWQFIDPYNNKKINGKKTEK